MSARNRRRCMAALVACLVFLAAAAAALAAGPDPGGGAAALSPRALLEQAAAAGEAGRWEEAERDLREVVSRGIHDPEAWYDLGTVLAHEGKYGEAILALRRALRLDPRHEDARANLEWVRARLADASEGTDGARDLLARWLALLPERGALVAAIALEWIGAALLLFGLFRARRRAAALRRAGIAALVLAALLALPPLGLAWLRATDRSAVVLAERAEARSGPGEDNPVLFTVHEGLEVELGRARGDWVYVRVPGGPAGWLPRSALAPVHPDGHP